MAALSAALPASPAGRRAPDPAHEARHLAAAATALQCLHAKLRQACSCAQSTPAGHERGSRATAAMQRAPSRAGEPGVGSTATASAPEARVRSSGWCLARCPAVRTVMLEHVACAAGGGRHAHGGCAGERGASAAAVAAASRALAAGRAAGPGTRACLCCAVQPAANRVAQVLRARATRRRLLHLPLLPAGASPLKVALHVAAILPC